MTDREILALRHRVRGAIRRVFDASGYLEVDTPVLSSEILPEPYIDPFELALDGPGSTTHFLQASPESLMKRLLAAGSGPIYQFARAFRAGERGERHDVEFVLLEWYAPGTSLDETAAFLATLCRETVGGVHAADGRSAGIERVTCRDAFLAHAGVDPLEAPLEAMREAGRREGLRLPESHPEHWDAWYELLLSEVVSPRLGHAMPTMLEAWPASQGAFARLDPADGRVARRFELFLNGVELANGWEEETSRSGLVSRIEAANRIRSADGRRPLPMPQKLVAAHGEAMPEGVGAALGFDRLVMLAAGADSIDAVRCFSSRTA